jgi:hypothetical protein
VHFDQCLRSETCVLRKNNKGRKETMRMSFLILLLGLISKTQTRERRCKNCIFSCEIWSSRGVTHEVCHLLEHDAIYSGIHVPTFRIKVLSPSSG